MINLQMFFIAAYSADRILLDMFTLHGTPVRRSNLMERMLAFGSVYNVSNDSHSYPCNSTLAIR